MHRYTREQKEFIKENAVGLGTLPLTVLINTKFGINLEPSQIRSFKKNNKISSGLNGQYKKGHTPYTKGKPATKGWKANQFKKGQKPHNYLPVGTERVNGDNYVDIKIADPDVWKGKHILTWEKHNGPVPEGKVIIFGDKNNRNFDINNLLLVTRGELATLNRYSLIKNDSEITKAGINIVKVKQAISRRSSNENERLCRRTKKTC